MDKLTLEGGQRLSGEVQVSGAKNAALPILVSSLLSPHPCCLENIPDVVDIRTMYRLLSVLGTEIAWNGPRLLIHTETLKSPKAPYALVSTMRASILVLGPLVARWGEAIVPLPGGCAKPSSPGRKWGTKRKDPNVQFPTESRHRPSHRALPTHLRPDSSRGS